ncbi:MAG TPA: helix-turn-helix domain-containing protein, partial [Solirubrobacteraceae bacterium]|nr:helix-turn-helix domain-containing protein [Solirubrobacteraceae bacterium]
WSLLPGPTFTKSFLRTYADQLGLDGKLLVEEYKLRHERPSDLDLQPISPNLGTDRRRRPPGPPRIPRAWLVGLAVIALLTVFAALGSNTQKSTPTAPHQRAGQPHRKSPGAPQTAQQRKAKAAAAARRRRQALARRRVHLRLTPQTPVRVCLKNASGKTVASGVLTPGSKQPQRISKRFTVTIGIGGLTLRWGGKTLRKAAGPGPVGFAILPGGKHTNLPAAKRPQCP